MDKVLAKVTAFHEKFKLPVNEGCFSRKELRFDLIDEELCELWTALEANDPVAALDALGDIIYTTAGAAVEWGLPLPEAFDEIHRSNMTKEGGGYRADGKVLKGPNYSPPDIAGVLARHKVATELPESDAPPILDWFKAKKKAPSVKKMPWASPPAEKDYNFDGYGY